MIRKRNYQGTDIGVTRILLVLALLVAGCATLPEAESPAPNPVPQITTLAPSSALAGGSGFALTVEGAGFVPGTVLRWAGVDRPTTLVSSTQLTAEIRGEALARAGTVNVTILNPSPGGGTSAGVVFNINNPSPVVPLISPASATAGDPDLAITATGTGFVVDSVIRWNGSDRSTIFVNSTQVWANVSEADLSTPQTAAVAVVNPGPGGGISETRSFFIHDPIDLMPKGIAARASVSLTGGDSDGASYDTAMSGDGRYIGFASAAQNLVANDTNLQSDVFLARTCVREGRNCTATRIHISIASGGGAANGGSFSPAVDYDGRYVAFYSFGSNLVTDDTNGVADIVVRDTCLGAPGGCVQKTVRVSVSSSGGEGDGGSFDPVITPDGRFVAFRSSASNLVDNDGNGVDDIFVHDRDADGDGVFDEPGAIATTRVSLGPGETELEAPSADPAIDANGRYVVFQSDSRGMGVVDLLYRDTCQGAPAGCQPSTLLIALVNEDSEDANSRPAAISADGRFVAFSSYARDLVVGDLNFAEDVFLHDTCTGAPAGCTPGTIRISVNSEGEEAAGDSSFPSMSASGRYVAFHSDARNLVGDDTNSVDDVFVRDTCTGAPPVCQPTTIRVSETTNGVLGNDQSFDPALCADGRVIAFASRASTLVDDDRNGLQDILVAVTDLE